ncbi:uncharacterized mitochondrial protein AtMg00310-like [Humulus lupulus]|uniref:uncharacterized mitochondrial protein AtMg00310-like n=1 Tax=Humulus lupulus TaxID=3486 RepID=UPI002B404FEB|nr:uncharacterized mitochondrial protein AtMg00310-like [Humulus lupulus]
MRNDIVYVGLLLFKLRKRLEDLNFLVEKVLKRVQGRAAKLDSSPNRKVDKALRDFWWGDTETRQKTHTMSWNNLCKPKVEGGLGFQIVDEVNKDFLTKLAWKVMVENTSLWSTTMKAKYGKGMDFLDMEVKQGDSVMWKTILNAREALQKGICMKIGNG